MSFLNILLLGGLATAVIPIAIHLLNRHRFRVVKWGAMHLLDSVLLTNRRRLRIEQLILLIVRISIPALLALCLARPILTGMRNLIHDAKTSMVLLLDNSYSMEAGDSVRTTFAVAREEAQNIIGDLPRGSDLAIIGMAGPLPPAVEGPGTDTGKMSRGLTVLDGGFGTAAVVPSLETAAGLFASRMHSSDRVIMVLSDFQKTSWSAADAPDRHRVMELFKAQPVHPELFLYHVGKEVTDNVAVESLDLSRNLLGIGQPVRVRANLRNFGTHGYPDLRVYFKVDGKEKSAAQIALNAGESNQVLFTTEFDKPGSHVVEVYADADPLKADNTCLASIPVVDRIPVLVVSGDPNPEPLRAETAFLEIALQPFSAGKAGLGDLIVPQVIREEELAAPRLADTKVVILANVRQLRDDQREALENFVRDGGGLLVFPGDRANATWYNSRFAADGSGLLPYQMVSLAGSVKSEDKPGSILARHYDHPALALFNDPRNGSLSGAEIRLWYKLTRPTANPVGMAPPLVMAELDTGDPFLVERAFGEGRVIQCAIPCDADWSNLPLRSFYLPMMQELVTYLAAKVYPPRNVQVGRPIAAFLPGADVDKIVTVVDPRGERHTARVMKKGSRGVVEFKETSRPGLYVLETPGGEPLHFVVLTSRAESDLTCLNGGELQALAKEMGGKVVTSWKEFRALEKTRRNGQELWLPLLWLVVAMMFTELVLEQFFAKRRLA